MNRRNFLRLAALTAGMSIPALSGSWWLSNRGNGPLSTDCFAPDPWQDTHPSGQILVLVNEDTTHPFGRFLAEILWAEGLNAFTAARLTDITPAFLSQFSCVLVSSGGCTDVQASQLANYAENGGKLVVFQPEGLLAQKFGLSIEEKTITECAVVTNPQHPLAAGIVTQPLSVHVEANLYSPQGAEVVARLDDAETHPAVFLSRSGSGLVVTWAYDLAQNIVLTRQGNPALSLGSEDSEPQRPADLLSGYMNFDRMNYPQADEQQRLLANIVTWLCEDHLPLPRLWYFPGKARSMLLVTSDSHRNTFTALQRITSLVEKYSGAVTLNYTPPLVSDLGLAKIQVENFSADLNLLPRPYFPSPQQMADLRSRGHEITLHPYISESYVESWKSYWNAFTRLKYGPVSQTSRTHGLQWCGWADAARIQAGFGLRMNTDYYIYGSQFDRGSNDWYYGHFTGSGLPMRFANSDGRMLNIYQQVTQVADEYLIRVPWNNEGTLGPEQGVSIYSRFLQSSLDGNFTAVMINYHSDPYDLDRSWCQPAMDLMSGTLSLAAQKGVPIWTAEHWLNFTTQRQKAHFDAIRWQDGVLDFDLLAAGTPADGLTVLVPLQNKGVSLSQVQVDGKLAPFNTWKVGGVDYGLAALDPGSHHVRATYG